MNLQDDDLPLHAWERKAIAGLLTLLIGAFLAWAGVVFNGTQTLLQRFDELNARLAKERLEDTHARAQIIGNLDRRLSLLEARQAWLLKEVERRDGVTAP